MNLKKVILESILTEDRDNRDELIQNVRRDYSNIKKIKWTNNPKIGWWEDRTSLIMFHGTHYSNLPKILESGIFAPSSGPTAGWVSMAFDPFTSFGYASMTGGESNFRAAGGKARTAKPYERCILVCKFPMTWVKQNMNEKLTGNMPQMRKHLTDKNLYDNWKKTDHEYYMACELQFPTKIDKKFIVGYMFKE